MQQSKVAVIQRRKNTSVTVLEGMNLRANMKLFNVSFMSGLL